MSNEQISILIVEDHMVTRLGLKIALDDYPGLVVVGEAEDGYECLRKIEQLKPAVVLLDIGLPQLDGIGCLSIIKSRALSTRTMIRSSHEEYAAILSAFAAGADGYCLKDSHDDLLAEGIHCLAGGRAWIDPRTAGHLLDLFTPGAKLRSSRGFGQLDRSGLTEEEVALLRAIANRTQTSLTHQPESGEDSAALLRELMKKIGDLACFPKAL